MIKNKKYNKQLINNIEVRLESGEILPFKLFSLEWCSEYGWGDTCVTPAIKADNWRLQKTTISYLMHVKLCTALMDVGLWYKTVHTWTVLVRDYLQPCRLSASLSGWRTCSCLRTLPFSQPPPCTTASDLQLPVEGSFLLSLSQASRWRMFQRHEWICDSQSVDSPCPWQK